MITIADANKAVSKITMHIHNRGRLMGASRDTYTGEKWQLIELTNYVVHTQEGDWGHAPREFFANLVY